MGGLDAHLRRRIALQGPLTVADYMAECLGHPDHGYYTTSDPIGAAGDFITAPEISQMFGELIGLWCAEAWRAMGAPTTVILAELGPGRGTLMADLLRAARTVPAFQAALRVHLVETSPTLRQRQKEALAATECPAAPLWHDDFAGLPDGPMLLVANEFFDALPIRQFQRTATGWQERRIDGSDDGSDDGEEEFRFVLTPGAVEPLIPQALMTAPVGSILEICPAAIGLGSAIGERVTRSGGAALIIDYGHGESALGDTLQAVKNHAYHPILATPGEADLTAHVDFAALSRAAHEAGASVHGPVTQGQFLADLGIDVRAATLMENAMPAQAADIDAARRRLIDAAGPGAMGILFKVIAFQYPDLPPPPGFS